MTIQLPYLQVFLDELYRHISKDKSREPKTHATLSVAALDEIGDIGDILRDFLEGRTVEIAQELGTKSETIWKILSPFVTIEGTKDPISLQRLQDQLHDIDKALINKVVTALINDRILRFLEDDELYEVAHDSLALAIASKRSDEEIALLEVKRLIKSQTNLKADARELFSEKQLNFMEPFLPKIKLERAEAEMIDNSRKAVGQSKAAAKKRRRMLQIAVAVAFSVILYGFIMALYQRSRAEAALKDVQKKEAELQNTAAVVAKLTAQREPEVLNRFNDARSRASVLIDAGACPSDLLQALYLLAMTHSDSTNLLRSLDSLKRKNPNCQ